MKKVVPPGAQRFVLPSVLKTSTALEAPAVRAVSRSLVVVAALAIKPLYSTIGIPAPSQSTAWTSGRKAVSPSWTVLTDADPEVT
eukprot:scaffold1102_cov256-Pinguiococcus_pyrenoidosus.AAC.33